MRPPIIMKLEVRALNPKERNVIKLELSITSLKNSFKTKDFLNIILYSIASCISLFGTSIYNFALGLYVLKVTGSGLSFATTLVLGILSTILVNPFAGVLADRLDKKFLAIITDLLNGVLLIGLYLLTIGYTLSLPMIYVTTFLLNVFTTVYGISIEASKPNLVSEKRLISLNSISKVIQSASSILGPMIGGVIFAFIDIRYFILVNGISFFISAMLHGIMNFKFSHSHKEIIKEKMNFKKDIQEGVNYLKTSKNILNMFGVFIALNFFLGLSITVPLPYIINNVLKLSTKAFGIIEAAFPIGMILGALLIKKVMATHPYGKIIKFTGILLSLSMVAIGFSVILSYKVNNEGFYLVYFILTMILAGIAISFIDIPIFYILQQVIPEELRGRVLSLGISIAKVILPIALILTGILINHIPSYILPMLGGAGLCIYTVFCTKLE